jgi:hypothetical protein
MSSFRGQAATEYTIILAVVIILLVLLVSLLRPTSNTGLNGAEAVDSTELASQKIGVLSYSLNPQGMRVLVKNNEGVPVSISAISLGGVDCTSNLLPLTLGPEQRRSFDCYSIVSVTAGVFFEYELIITAASVETNVSKTFFEGVLKGYTTDIQLYALT